MQIKGFCVGGRAEQEPDTCISSQGSEQAIVWFLTAEIFLLGGEMGPSPYVQGRLGSPP